MSDENKSIEKQLAEAKRELAKYKAPRPGSEEARSLGCKCPVMDNRGRPPEYGFVVTSSCKMHWTHEEG